MSIIKLLSVSIFAVTLILSGGNSAGSGEMNDVSLYTKSKFFVMTKEELKVSEATGEVSVITGIKSIDEKNSRYGINKIKPLFRLNNGDPAVFNELGMSRIYVFYAEATADISKAVSDYSSDLNIEYSEPNYIGFAAGKPGRDFKGILSDAVSMPNDTYFYKQWYLKNVGDVMPTAGGKGKSGADINIVKAWDIETGNDNIIVAILDSGINDDSPDLAGKLWVNKKEIWGNGRDDDNNGYIDDVKGWNFAADNNDNHDGFGHGTNIASVIGAKANNNYGFAGMNFKAKLMNCKNLTDDNSGEYEWWAKSIQYAVDNGARVINMSEGGSDYSKTLKKAVEYAINKGVFLSAAMMNYGTGKSYYPAAFPGVFAVGATDTDDKRCKQFTWGGGSCWGKHIQVVAPGNRIYGVDYENVNGFDLYWSGTSQATAEVSGLVSLLLSQNQSRTIDDIKKIITSTARDQIGDAYEDKPGWDQYMGWGRIDCLASLKYEYKGKIKQENTTQEEVQPREDNTSKQKDAKATKPQPARAKKQDADDGRAKKR